MAAMLIVHFVDSSAAPTRALQEILGFFSGRAMPLFVVLGGVGATIVGSRPVGADRRLLGRAVVLLALGLLLERLETPAIPILTTYGMLFFLAPLFRRVRTPPLLFGAGAVVIIASWTSPALGTVPAPLSAEMLSEPILAWWMLVFGGAYPLLPTAGFFVIGMVVGRLDLRAALAARMLIAGGAALAAAPWTLRTTLERGFGVELTDARLGWSSFTPKVRVDPSSFDWSAVLDTSPHTQMAGWTLASTGSALVVIGCSLEFARGVKTTWLEIIGRLALTFYVLQLVLTDYTTSPFESAFGEQILLTAGIWFGFAAFAQFWVRYLGAGPLERLLRLGDGPRVR